MKPLTLLSIIYLCICVSTRSIYLLFESSRSYAFWELCLFSVLFRLRAVCNRVPSRWGAQWKCPGDTQNAAQQLPHCPLKVRLNRVKSAFNKTNTYTSIPPSPPSQNKTKQKKACLIRQVTQSSITSPLYDFCSWCYTRTLIIAIIAF